MEHLDFLRAWDPPRWAAGHRKQVLLSCKQRCPQIASRAAMRPKSVRSEQMNIFVCHSVQKKGWHVLIWGSLLNSRHPKSRVRVLGRVRTAPDGSDNAASEDPEMNSKSLKKHKELHGFLRFWHPKNINILIFSAEFTLKLKAIFLLNIRISIVTAEFS